MNFIIFIFASFSCLFYSLILISGILDLHPVLSQYTVPHPIPVRIQSPSTASNDTVVLFLNFDDMIQILEWMIQDDPLEGNTTEILPFEKRTGST